MKAQAKTSTLQHRIIPFPFDYFLLCFPIATSLSDELSTLVRLLFSLGARQGAGGTVLCT